MVIIRTSAVEVSIQAVSPLSNFAPAATGAGVWAIADTLQAEANAAAHNSRRTIRQATLISLLPETLPGHATPGSGTPLPGAQPPTKALRPTDWRPIRR